MIKKTFKTIFILTLCLGITLPANAGSVSVSDGSAFITKSELAYQMNTLSSRMTQLENSLDSKIDTLVSSYLTRNGIWNGVKQTINMTNFSFWPSDVTVSSFQGSYDGNLASGTYIPNITKSGMLVFSYKYRNYSGFNNNNTRWGYNLGQKDGSWPSDSGMTLTLNVSVSGELKYSTVLLSSIATEQSGYGLFLFSSLANSFITANVIVFVYKGNNVTYTVREVVHLIGVTFCTPIKFNESKLYMVFNDDAKVY